MPNPSVYVETTISSYLAARPSRDAVTAARQIITRRWWDHQRDRYDLFVSAAVEAECGRGDGVVARRRRQFLAEASLFPIDERILELAPYRPRSDTRQCRGRRDSHCCGFPSGM
jgi:hypothetical protein